MRTLTKARGLLLTALMLAPALLAGMPAAEAASVAWGAVFAGNGDEGGWQVATDAAGFVYVVGTTLSTDLPVVNALQPAFGGAGPWFEGSGTTGDLFVAKVHPTGAVVWSTYLGGSSGDAAGGIAVDALGDVYVLATTMSTDFPGVAPGAAQTSNRGNGDAVVAKLRGDGSGVVWATYYGGTGREIVPGLAVDALGRAVIGGDTRSSGLAVPGGWDPTFNGGFNDAFVAVLSADGTAVLAGTYLGGDNSDEVDGLTLDLLGNVVAVGYTLSSGFPTTPGAYDTTYNGGAFPGDGWVTKLPLTLSAPVFSTFLGGAEGDGATDVVADALGNVHFAGHTRSTNLPLSHAAQAAAGGGRDAFMATLSADGSQLLFSSYVGGSGDEVVSGLAYDPVLQRSILLGSTASANFPLANPMQPALRGPLDAYITAVDEAAGQFRFSTLLGGTGSDGVSRGVALPGGGLLLPGFTTSTDFPLPGFAARGGSDALLLRISAPLPTAVPTVQGTPGNGDWWRGAPEVSLVCPDGAAIAYRVDGGAETPYTGPFTLGDGDHTVDTRCTDAHGNSGTAAYKYRVDGTRPRTRAQAEGPSGDDGWYRGPVRVGMTCEDATSGCAETISEQIDNSEPCCTFTASAVDVTAEGIHTIGFRSRDVAGNEEAQQKLTVKVDSFAPETTAEPVGLRGTNGWFRSAVAVGFACADATSGCAATLAENIANAEPVDEEPVDIQGLTTVRFRSRDVAGNTEADQVLELRIDSVAPRTTAEPVGTVGRNGWYRSAVTLGLGCADATSGCAATLAEDIANAEPVDAEPVDREGLTQLRLRSEDVAGNVEPDQVLELRIDSVAPRTTAEPVGLRGTHGWFRSAVAVGFACADATSGCDATHASVDGMGLAAGAMGIEVIGDGSHEVAFASEDVAGNAEGRNLLGLRIDATPPTVALLTPEEGSTTVLDRSVRCTLAVDAARCGDLLPGTLVAGPVTLRAAASDATSGVAEVRFLVDGLLRHVDTEGPYDHLWRANEEPLGEHRLEVVALDAAGNEAWSQARVVTTVPLSLRGLGATVDLVELGR